MGDRLKVYIETSFVSYLTGGPTSDAKVASDQAFTRKWWETERDKCDCFVSEFTLDESFDGRPDMVACRRVAVEGIPLVRPDDQAVAALSKELLAEHAVPKDEVTDAMHIAAASVAGMDILLTWNCRHLANPHTLPKTRNIVTAAGYICPAIMTPKTFIENQTLEAKL